MTIELQNIRQDWCQRGFSYDIWVDPPGQVWSDFIHEADELVMLIEGDIELQFNGQILRPGTGKEVLIPAGASHTVINIGTVANRWLYGYKTTKP